jgi:hypothetical protein
MYRPAVEIEVRGEPLEMDIVIARIADAIPLRR